MSYEYTIGTTALVIPFPPEGSFMASREDLCGPVQITLDETSLDQDVVTHSSDQTIIESNDNSLGADSSPLILKYRTTLRDYPDYSDGPEYQVWIFLQQFEPYRPVFEDEEDENESEDDDRPSMHFESYVNGEEIEVVAGRAYSMNLGALLNQPADITSYGVGKDSSAEYIRLNEI